MSYNVNDNELESLLKRPGPIWYQYFIGKVTDWHELWSIGDDDGWALMADDSGNELVPVWPAERYVDLLCTNQWREQKPKRISIDDWLNKWTPGIIRDGRKIAVFPIPKDQGVVVDAVRLQQDIQNALDAYE